MNKLQLKTCEKCKQVFMTNSDNKVCDWCSNVGVKKNALYGRIVK